MSEPPRAGDGELAAEAPRELTYFWDFFGPRAQHTAAHFQKHLEEFLSKNALVGCVTGTRSEGAGHCAAFCCTPVAAQATVVGALRPRRAL